MARADDDVADDLLELVDSLGRLVDAHRRGGGAAEGLQPLHVRALAYLGRANTLRLCREPAAPDAIPAP